MTGLFEELKRILTPSGSLTEQALTSGIWVTLINVSDRGLQILRLIVLARLLTPADFGLMGIALLTLGALRQFSRLGIDTALIQRKEENVDDYLNTAWLMKIARGLIIAVVAYLGAPYVAAFFNEPRTTDIVRVIAILPLFEGFGNPGVMYLRKNLDFDKQFGFVMSSTVANVTVSIVAALVLGNVWALVFGSVAGSVVTVVASYVVHDFRPSLSFDRDIAGGLFDYGKWILGSGIVLFLINQGDDVFVGWFIGATALGFYQLAYRLSNAPATEVTQVISSVVFPTYSKIQSDIGQLRTGYYKTLQITTAVAFPMAAGIIVVAPMFVRTFLGEQWVPMIVAMQILALWGTVRAVGSTVGPLFQAVGRPDVNTKLQTLKLILIVIFIYPATARWGIAGTAAVIVGNAFIVNPIADYLAIRQVEGSVLKFARLIAVPVIASTVMAAAAFAVRTTVGTGYPVIDFGLVVLTGIVVYAVSILTIESRIEYGLIQLVRDAVRTVV